MIKKLVLLAIVLCLSVSASLALAAPDSLSNWAKTPTTLTFYGQSTFVLTHGETRMIIDPWLTGNPLFPPERRAEAIQGATHILITHGHFDHAGGATGLKRALELRQGGPVEVRRFRPDGGHEADVLDAVRAIGRVPVRLFDSLPAA